MNHFNDSMLNLTKPDILLLLSGLIYLTITLSSKLDGYCQTNCDCCSQHTDIFLNKQYTVLTRSCRVKGWDEMFAAFHNSTSK